MASRGCVYILSHPSPTQLFISTFKKPSVRFFNSSSRLNASPKTPKIRKTKIIVTGTPEASKAPKASNASKAGNTPKAGSKHEASSTPNASNTPNANNLPVSTKSQLGLTNRSPSPSHKITPENYIAHLISKRTPTLLYTAPSQLMHQVTSYTGATFCYAYTAIQYNLVILNPPEGLAIWVTYGFTGICFFMVCMGTYFALGPSRVIRKIMAVPVSIPLKKDMMKMGIPRPRRSPNSIGLELHMKPFLSSSTPIIGQFFGPTRINTTSRVLSLTQHLTPFISHYRQIHADEEARTARFKKKSKENILLLPFIEAAYWSKKGFRAARRSLSREGFVDVHVEGEGVWKIDAMGVVKEGNSGLAALDLVCQVRKHEGKVLKWMKETEGRLKGAEQWLRGRTGM